jgi:16S rRNA (guanine(966)-N(2))-methyltransferase RsmD
MRIISGKFKGIRFEPPQNITARPTTDFAKESLFNVLNKFTDFEDISVLDLFSGTGSIAYEFISRGAKSVTAIEMSNQQIDFIKKTINKLKINNIHIYKSEVFRYLEKCSEKYDFIFADPPYQMKETADLPKIIFEKNILRTGGIFILEHGKTISFSDDCHFIEERKYGNVHFSLFTII